MAITSAIAVFIGFYGSYYLKALFGSPALSSLVHVHGMLFTAWIILLIAQTWLVSIRRTDIHRRLGVAGAVLAGTMTIAGVATAVAALRLNRMPIDFFAVPMGSVVVFPTLVASALLLRHQLDAHKRLMLVATAELLTAAVGRWPVVSRSSAFVDYAVTDALILLPLVAYDLIARRRLHAATLWGSVFLIGSQALRTTIGHTATWMAFANWVKG